MITTKQEKLFLAEMQQLESEVSEVELTLSPVEAWIVMAQLQLALRHPDNNGGSRAIALVIARRIEAIFKDYPVLSQVAARGFITEAELLQQCVNQKTQTIQ